MAASPGMAGRPGVLPSRECGSGLHGIIAAELRGKTSAGSRLCGSGGGGSFSRRLRSQPLQARLIALQHALLALQSAVFGLQQSLLRALRPEAFRPLLLQSLHTLLHALDAILPLYALAR